MKKDGVLVSKAYLTKLDARVFGDQAPEPIVITPPSRFYDVRPAVITSGWVEDASGVWYAQARFVTQDGNVDETFSFPVWSPTSTSEPETTANETRVYVVWRGRWELVGGLGGGGEVRTPDFTFSIVNATTLRIKIS